MIKSITSTSPSLQIYNGYPQIPYMRDYGEHAGALRLNPFDYRPEVYDGERWVQIRTETAIGLAPEVEELLSWLHNFRREREQEQRLIQSNAAVRRAWEQFQIVSALAQEEHSHD